MHDHLVEFYETDALLVESVRNFAGPSLQDGHPVILVATAQHRAAFVAAMESFGIDVQARRDAGLFVDRDARDTLSGFMVDGSPDPFLFEQVVGGLVDATGHRDPELRVYGEMVALLWEEGNRNAALQLESLWNKLSEIHPFTLMCAYPLSCMEWGPDTAPFRGICSTHSSVRVRFSAPQTEANLPDLPVAAADDFSRVKGLGSELSALKEVIRNANQMGRLAENKKSVTQSGPSGFDYKLNQ